MKATFRNTIATTFVFALLQTCVLAQATSSDSTLLITSLQSLTGLYNEYHKGNSHLYNGVEFIDPFKGKITDGFPYYLTDEWLSGSIWYDGHLYENVSFMFDLYQTRLIVEHPQNNREIELSREKIKYFKVNDKLFVRLVSPATGFYEMLYDGKIKIYILHSKSIREKMTTNSLTIEFPEKQKIYILKDGKYFPVASKKSAINVLTDQKTDLNKFLKQEHISYRNNKFYALQRMGEYCDQMNKMK